MPRSKGGGDELANLMPAHRSCNSRRGTALPPGMVATHVVVTGPPGAGKTTYVQAHASPGDVVVDLDAICMALSGPGTGDPHRAPDHLRFVAQAARQAAIRACRELARGPTVWVIHTNPTPDQRASYLRTGATFVAVNPGAEVVAAQGQAAGRPADQLAAAQSMATPVAVPADAPPPPDGLSARWKT